MFIAFLAIASAPNHCVADLKMEPARIVPGKPFWIATRFRIQKGWHIYWLNPGDSGLATRIDCNLPKTFSFLEQRWPPPKEIASAGIVSYGYENVAVVLTKIMPPKSGLTSHPIIIAKLNWMACEQTCVIEQQSVSLNLSRGHLEGSRSLLASARAALPADGRLIEPIAQEQADHFVLSFRLNGARSAYFFCQDRGVVEPSGQQALKRIGGRFELAIPKARAYQPKSGNLTGVLSVEYDRNIRKYWAIHARIQSKNR